MNEHPLASVIEDPFLPPPIADVKGAVEQGDSAIDKINSDLVSIVDRMVAAATCHRGDSRTLANRVVELADEAVSVLARVGRAQK